MAKGRKRKPRKPGPTPKLDDKATRDRLFKHLAAQGSRGKACRLAGIKSYQTLLTYIKHNPDFAQELINAEEQALDDIEANVFKSAKTDAHLGIKVLERKRTGWQKRQQVQHGGKVRYDINISTDEQRSRLAALDERLGLGGPADAGPLLPGTGGGVIDSSANEGAGRGTGDTAGDSNPGQRDDDTDDDDPDALLVPL